MLNITVIYALPDEQKLYRVELPPASTVRHAIEKSHILRDYPEINLLENTVGVFGERAELDTLLHDGDRVEIYRPLIIDPKEARRLRAKRKN